MWNFAVDSLMPMASQMSLFVLPCASRCRISTSAAVSCGASACAFAGAYSQFEALGAVVIGVSRDSAASHQRFAEKNSLPFILLSDPERKAIEAYGVWQEKKNYGKVSMGVVRSTYVIDENGVIEKVMPKVKPDTNAAEILEYLRAEG